MPVALLNIEGQAHLNLDRVVDIHLELVRRAGIGSLDLLWIHVLDNFVRIGHGERHESKHSFDHVVGHLFCSC